MSGWRRKGFTLIPERHDVIERAASIHQLWFDLLGDCEHAYKSVPQNTDLIDRIFRFAEWCFNPKQNRSLREAVAVSFYEHLADFGPARRDLPNRINQEQFEELLPAFATVLEERPLAEFQAEFRAAVRDSARTAG
jgi:hypothetical protein